MAQNNNSIPDDIIKIQNKLTTYKIGSINYKKYSKILAKHIKANNMKKRLQSNIKTIDIVKDLSGH